jgi:hypothetical protein
MKHAHQSLGDRLAKLKPFLPSRRVGTLIGGTLSIIFIVFAIRSFGGVSYKSKSLSVVTVGDAIAKDTDGDGVADWEERLWGTSSTNPDSDNDGVPDGTEISERKEQMALKNGYNTEAGYTESSTDVFARELFVTYSALKEQGDISQTGADNLANAAVSASVEKLPSITPHTTADLKIVSSNAESNLRYQKAISKLSQASGRFATEFTIINQGIAESDPNLLRTAGTYDKVYSDYATALLKLDVPVNQANNHVRLLNNLGYLVATLPELDALESDVLRGVSLYTVYTKAYQDMFLTFEAIGKTQ